MRFAFEPIDSFESQMCDYLPEYEFLDIMQQDMMEADDRLFCSCYRCFSNFTKAPAEHNV